MFWEGYFLYYAVRMPSWTASWPNSNNDIDKILHMFILFGLLSKKNLQHFEDSLSPLGEKTIV